MTAFERLILLSEWLTLKLFRRERMTLSALAQEKARNQEGKAYATIIDTLLWFDKNHCRKAYAYYRSCQRNKNNEPAQILYLN